MNPITGAPNEGCATARDYESFRAMLNRRRMSLGLSFLGLDALTGLQSGYTAKLIAEPRVPRNYQKCIGPKSMGKLLTALGVEIALVPAPASSDFLEGELSYPQGILATNASRGGLARASKLSAKRRSEIARIAAFARWKK